MFDAGPPHEQAPLASLGQLRECVAAIRNLKQLVGSLSVGPKVLTPIVSEVAECVASVDPVVSSLTDSLRETFPAYLGVLDGLSESALEGGRGFVARLRPYSGGPLQAKARLEVEHLVADSLPQFERLVRHWELLVDAASAVPLEMSLSDVLLSGPASPADQKREVLPVYIPSAEVYVRVPPRVILNCLAAWWSQSSPGQDSGIVVEVEGTQVVFRAGIPSSHQLELELPVFPSGGETGQVVLAALSLHQASVDVRGMVLKSSPPSGDRIVQPMLP